MACNKNELKEENRKGTVAAHQPKSKQCSSVRASANRLSTNLRVKSLLLTKGILSWNRRFIATSALSPEVFFFLFATFIPIHEKAMYRYVLDGEFALAWELQFLGHLSST